MRAYRHLLRSRQFAGTPHSAGRNSRDFPGGALLFSGRGAILYQFIHHHESAMVLPESKEKMRMLRS
ncbi:MAG TPA: hypothetical protein DFL85_16935 [Lentisphaeria bacterium]|nr:hypothetical protein [Lentisphaeria bacterium]HCH87179.1 hypothetical protein [Lentisphaeria bacterium]